MISWLRRIFKRQERMHKRPFITAVTVSVIFLLIASFLFISMGMFRMESDYPQDSVGQERSGLATLGLGVNIPYIPSTNLVWDASFENNYVEKVFSTAEAEGHAVYLHGSTEVSSRYDDSFFKNGTIRIMTYDEDGSLHQTLDAKVKDYATNQLGIWKAVQNQIHSLQGVNKISSGDGMAVAVLSNGTLLTDIASSHPGQVKPEEKESFVDAVYMEPRGFAVTYDGTFYTSSGGKTWSRIVSAQKSGAPLRAIASLGHIAIACGEKGEIMVTDSGSVHHITTGADCDFNTAVSDGMRVLICGDKGKVYMTSNGSVFRALTSQELDSKEEDTWVLSSVCNGKIVLVGSKGQMAVGYFDEKLDRWVFDRYSDARNKTYSPKQLVCFPGGDIWMLANDGYIYTYSFRDQIWQQVYAEKDNAVEAMGITSDETVIIARKDNFYTSSVYTKVTLDQDIGDVVVQNGDICYLSVAVPSIGDQGNGVWEVMGEDTVVQSVQDAPKSAGEKSAHLRSLNDDVSHAHFLSQIISRDEVSPMQDKVFYHLRVFLKQNGIEKGHVLAWISGLSEPIGTTFTEVSGNWREYTFTFAWPKTKHDEEQTIRLNLGFFGKGDLWADNICLEREGYSGNQIEPQLERLLADSAPEYIRLESLRFGSLGRKVSTNLQPLGNERLDLSSEENVSGTGVISLESTMRLVKQSNSNPWFVVDSAFGNQDTDVLLQYLCGSITEPYGKMRVDNGTAVPWMRQFNRVVVEICDDNGLFETDLQKSAYVDFVISAFSRSKYYIDFKDKVTFIDGMNYDGSTMPSQADFHSSRLRITNDVSSSEKTFTDDITKLVSQSYSEYQDRIPRLPSSFIQESKGEWISNLDISVVSRQVYENDIVNVAKPFNAANILRILLEDLGYHTSFVSVDLPITRLDGDADEEFFFADDADRIGNRRIQSQNMTTALRSVGMLRSVAQGYRMETSWVVPLSKTNEKDYSVQLLSYAYYAEGKTYLIVVNPTASQQQFLIETDTPIRDIKVNRYSDTCKQIAVASTGNILRLNERRYTLQAGQVIVAEIPSQRAN